MTRPSLWNEDTPLPEFPALHDDLEADVVVVGAGITGMTTALLLQRAGRRVIVIEAHRLGSGETGHTTAHLTELIDARYHVLQSKFGRDGARLAAESVRAAIDRIESFVAEFGVACGFARTPGYLFAETAEQKDELERELASVLLVGGDAAWVGEVPLPFEITGAIRLERQAKFHPLEYLRELTARFVAAGGTIYERTRMLSLEDHDPRRVETSGGTLTVRDVVVATNVPVSSHVAIHTKIAAYRTYALAAKLDRAFPDGLFADMQRPYHYLRAQHTSLGTFLIVGGEDHKTGQNPDTEGSFRRLGEYTASRFPGSMIRYQWSGQIIEPADGLPFIGKTADHVYVSTGFSGTGITFGTLAAMIVSDAVLGVPNPWAELYDPTRVKPLAQARQYLSENLDFPAFLARDRLSRGDTESMDAVGMGEGRLLRAHGKMLAVYRDDEGHLHARSAACTHMGCHVHWNAAERTWDCPCHGSRFDVDGVVLNGPATSDLEAAALEYEPVVRTARAAT